MGGFCGAISNRDVVLDVYFGTDYHSHLGTRRGGMAAWDPELGFQREIHNIENAPFRTKFDKTVGEMVGKRCIGSISDTDPSPCWCAPSTGPMPSAWWGSSRTRTSSSSSCSPTPTATSRP